MGNESNTAGKKVVDLGKNEDTAADKSAKLKVAFGNLGTALKTSMTAIAGVAASVAGLGGAIGKLVLDTAESSHSLEAMSAKTGITTEKLQEMSYVSDQLGIDTETITMSMAKLIRSMNSAEKGTGTAKDAFKELGVSVVDSSGNLRNNQDVFSEVVDKLRNVSDETKRDALSMEIFGKSAQEINPLIKAGSAEIARMSEEAHKVGAVMSDQSVKGMSELEDKLDSLKDGFKGTLGTLATAFLPGFKAGTDTLRGYLEDFANIVTGSGGDLGKMTEGMSGLVGKIVNDIATQGPQLLKSGLSVLQGIIKGILTSLPKLLPAVISMILTLVKFIIDNLPPLITAAVQIIVALANGIADALPKLIPAVVSAVLQIVKVIVENLPLLIDAALKLILALADGLIAALPILIPYIPILVQAIVDALIKSLPMIFKAAAQLIAALILGLIASIPALIKAIRQIGSIIGDTLKDDKMKSLLLSVGTAIVDGIWQGINSQYANLMNNVSGFFNGILAQIKAILGIHSPSKVFADIGLNMAAGVGVGFINQIAAVKKNIASSMAGISLSYGAAGAGYQNNQSYQTQNYYAPIINQYSGNGNNNQTKARRW